MAKAAIDNYLKKAATGASNPSSKKRQPRSSSKDCKPTHRGIVDLLIQYYHKDERQWICIPEMRVGTGYGKAASRSIDLFAINTYPSNGHRTIAYEVKVSRGDFQRDVRRPEKQRGARLYATEVYYVAPANMLQLSEIPLWAGLIEVTMPSGEPFLPGMEVPERTRCRVRREPVRQSRVRPSWGFICSLLRRLPDAK